MHPGSNSSCHQVFPGRPPSSCLSCGCWRGFNRCLRRQPKSASHRTNPDLYTYMAVTRVGFSRLPPNLTPLLASKRKFERKMEYACEYLVLGYARTRRRTAVQRCCCCCCCCCALARAGTRYRYIPVPGTSLSLNIKILIVFTLQINGRYISGHISVNIWQVASTYLVGLCMYTGTHEIAVCMAPWLTSHVQQSDCVEAGQKSRA